MKYLEKIEVNHYAQTSSLHGAQQTQENGSKNRQKDDLNQKHYQSRDYVVTIISSFEECSEIVK